MESVNGTEVTDPRQYQHYLAGPMSGYPEYNYPAFSEAVAVLRVNGFIVFSPHETPWPEGHDLMMENDLWEYMMKETDKLLTQCNSIILLPGWASSRGAKAELTKAMKNDFKVYTLAHGNLMGWNKEDVHEINRP
jgi:hypothetical protein